MENSMSEISQDSFSNDSIFNEIPKNCIEEI